MFDSIVQKLYICDVFTANVGVNKTFSSRYKIKLNNKKKWYKMIVLPKKAISYKFRDFRQEKYIFSYNKS